MYIKDVARAIMDNLSGIRTSCALASVFRLGTLPTLGLDEANNVPSLDQSGRDPDLQSRRLKYGYQAQNKNPWEGEVLKDQ
jgi:hypothetical protein